MRFTKSIKFRLTVWYLVILGVSLIFSGMIAYFAMLSNTLNWRLDNSLQTQATQLTAYLKQRGTLNLQDINAGGPPGQHDELILLYDIDGNLKWASSQQITVTQIDGLVTQAIGGRRLSITTKTTDGREIRLYGTPLQGLDYAALIVGRWITYEEVSKTVRIVLIFITSLAVVLAGVGGVFLINSALRPVDKITLAAREIEEGDLSRRIEIESDDELGRLASTLNQMIEHIEKALNRQRQFTADASHELRTPLAIIQAESTLSLEKERTLPEYQKSMELVSQEADYMSSVIGKLLFLARSDTGKETFEFDEINLKELLNELSSDIQVLANEKGLNFNLNPMEDLFVMGDRGKLRQLFLNILENAVRYTPSGSDISTSVVRGKGMVTVTVKDAGIGISEEHMPFIFERFYRVDKSRSRAEGGTGLGLAIAKQIAESHGGTIEVESQVGQGSTFHISLPLSNLISKQWH